MNLIADSRFRLVFQCQETSLWQISRSPLQEPKINPTFIIIFKYRSKCSIKTELNNRSFIVIIRILNPFKAKPPIGSSFPQDFSLIFRFKKKFRWKTLKCAQLLNHHILCAYPYLPVVYFRRWWAPEKNDWNPSNIYRRLVWLSLSILLFFFFCSIRAARDATWLAAATPSYRRRRGDR